MQLLFVLGSLLEWLVDADDDSRQAIAFADIPKGAISRFKYISMLQRPHRQRPKQFLEASGLCTGILPVESTSISIGILNPECAVVPPSSNVAAIPDDATESATWPPDRTFVKVKLTTNVFPVSPKPSRKHTTFARNQDQPHRNSNHMQFVVNVINRAESRYTLSEKCNVVVSLIDHCELLALFKYVSSNIPIKQFMTIKLQGLSTRSPFSDFTITSNVFGQCREGDQHRHQI